MSELMDGMSLTLTRCPEPGCPAPAEILDRRALHSTDGAVEHLRIQCLHRHHFLLPADRLPAAPAATADAGDRYRGGRRRIGS
ncbi:MAG: hypothetical protein J2P15_04300 [Micromonosporaceae bacterium]|nr:hypothetical protein [Micromonosporaceae bacterium]